jgi:hypothetical protein
MLNEREKILSALREKPLKVYEVMKRANIPNEEACQSLLLKMRDEGLVKFDIHKGRWLEPTGRAYACPMINSAKPIDCILPIDDGFRFALPILQGAALLARRANQSIGCRALPSKIFRLTRRANQRYQLARLTREEGRLAIVTNVRWDAVDADVPLTNGA